MARTSCGACGATNQVPTSCEPQVHQDDVRSKLPGHSHGLGARASLADHPKVGVVCYHSVQAAADERLMIGDQNPDSHPARQCRPEGGTLSCASARFFKSLPSTPFHVIPCVPDGPTRLNSARGEASRAR
jgi:hypothetical protein